MKFCKLILISLLLFSSSCSSEPSGPILWKKVDLPFLVQKQTFYNIAGVGDEIWVASSVYNKVLHFDGEAWGFQKIVGEPISGMEVLAISKDNVWLGGKDGRYARYNGKEWKEDKLTIDIVNGQYSYFHLKSMGWYKGQVYVLPVSQGIYLVFENGKWVVKKFPTEHSAWPHGFWSDQKEIFIGYRASSSKRSPGVLIYDGVSKWKETYLEGLNGFLSDILFYDCNYFDAHKFWT